MHYIDKLARTVLHDSLMKKTLVRGKLGLNKDNVRKIADERLAEVIGGWVPSTSATCNTARCQPFTILLDTATCK